MPPVSRRAFLRSALSASLLTSLSAQVFCSTENFPERRLAHSDVVVMGLYTRDQSLRLFRREIVNLVASAVSVEPGIEAGWHRQWVQRYVEDYLLQFGCLPDGVRRVQVFWGGYKDLGSFNFGRPERIALERSPYTRSWEQFTPQEKARFLKLLPLQPDIDVVAAGIPDHHLKFGWGWHRVWTHRYIGDHVLRHGELPEGKMSFRTGVGTTYGGSGNFISIDELVQRWPVHDLEHEESLWHPDRPRRQHYV